MEALPQGDDGSAGPEHSRAQLEVGGADLEVGLADERPDLARRATGCVRGRDVGLQLGAVAEIGREAGMPVGRRLQDVGAQRLARVRRR
jgi:hypothetical protein